MVQVTESRVFALSASGSVYVIAAQSARQRQNPTPGASRWGTSWLVWGDEAGFEHSEIVPAQKLAWGER